MLSDDDHVKPTTSTIAKLAEAEFEARERLRMLDKMNVPTDYAERKKAAVEYAEARAAAVAARRALDDAIQSS